MHIPSCASGRLVQFTGTCWFNASLNSMLLSETSKALLILKWKVLPTAEKKVIIDFGGLEKCMQKTASLKTMLYIVIYNILIKNEKAHIHQGDWIKELAGLAKAKYLTLTESTYRNLKIKDLQAFDNYGNGGMPFDAINVILGVLDMDFKADA